MPITPQEALQRTIEHREVFHDEMLHIVRLIMSGECSPVMMAALITGLRVKKETIGEITAAAQVMREVATKVALFFLAFVPQFIAPDAGNKALAFVLLGLLFNVNAIPVNTGWAVAAGWLARRGTVRQWMRVLDRVAGAMFIGFGIKLALSDSPLSSTTH